MRQPFLLASNVPALFFFKKKKEKGPFSLSSYSGGNVIEERVYSCSRTSSRYITFPSLPISKILSSFLPSFLYTCTYIFIYSIELSFSILVLYYVESDHHHSRKPLFFFFFFFFLRFLPFSFEIFRVPPAGGVLCPVYPLRIFL